VSDRFFWIGAVLLKTDRPTLFAPVMVLFLGLASSTAAARVRLAVLVVTDDGALADNLSEVAISHLAKLGDWDLVGGHELRGPLAEILPAGGLAACVAEPACRAALASAAQVERAIVGNVRQRDGAFLVDLTLVDLRTAKAEARSSETIPVDQARLISALREGIDRLFAPKLALPTRAAPKPALPLLATRPATPDGAQPSPLALRRDEDARSSRRESILPYVGLGVSAGAVVALSAAAVTGSFATEAPAGASRAAMQVDLQRREEYATATNVLLGVGTVCATGAAVVLYRWWHGIRRAPPGLPVGDAGLTR
jgi:hypothetical protein